MEWLNPVGIILNFISAFLIAPELIGINRIKKLEKSIENWLFEFTESTYRYQKGIKPFLGVFKKRSGFGILFYALFEYLAVFLLIYSSMSNYGAILLSLIFVSFYLQSLFVVWGYSEKLIKSHLIKIVVAFIVSLFFSLLVFLSPVLLLILAIVQFSGKVALRYSQFVLRVLVGENKVRNAIILTGIILFILGNALQFIAAL